jgi:uncharacterized membrane protein
MIQVLYYSSYLLIFILENVIKEKKITNTQKRKTGMGGFEPTNDGVKVHCLTTWRHPKSHD